MLVDMARCAELGAGYGCVQPGAKGAAPGLYLSEKPPHWQQVRSFGLQGPLYFQIACGGHDGSDGDADIVLIPFSDLTDGGTASACTRTISA